MESSPVQISTEIRITRPTTCDGWASERRAVDLTPLRELYRQQYQTASGSILVNHGESFLYEF